MGGLFDDDADAEDAGEGEADDLFADDADVDADEQTTPGKAARKKGAKTRKDSSTAEEGEDVGDLFADEDDADAAGEGDAADLFADEDDAEADEQTTPGKAARKKGAKTRKDSSTAEAEDVSDLFDDQEPSPEKKSAKKPRRSGEGDLGDVAGDALEEEAAETPRAKPTKGHKRKETQGFAAPESAVERDEKSRRGFALYASDEDAEQDQVTKSKSRRKARDLAAEEEEEEEEQPQARKGRREGRAPSEEEEAEERREGPAKPKREARPATAEEEKGKKQGKEAQAADPKSDEKKLNLDALTYQVTVEDLRTHMGISLVRDDHVKLIRRWDQKSRDNSIRLLLDDPKATQHPYALIPRITRFVKDGQVVQVNMLNLVRHFFQLFENVPQVIQLKSEPFFVTETPTMEWAIVACEALPDTLNKTFLEQRTVFNNYIQKYMSNDRRVRRRVLVEALYDIIVLNLVAKEPILRKTVDLTETRRGRQHQLCINFGAKGIRINSITRDQRHPQMGMCPSW
ncbi:MAG: hypothetical protein HYW07_11165 [Candidatus Latescibacteria bacterium]|nr:hypothetical protein [Candidatus Latescibacterota bacterium]